MKPKLNNSDYKQLIQQRILTALNDGQWHRNKELLQKTQITQRTLSKHLDILEKFGLIEKHTDRETGEYPYPVLYKTNKLTTLLGKHMEIVFNNAENIKTDLTKTKDPLLMLKTFHAINQQYFKETLQIIQIDKGLNQEALEMIAHYLFSLPYEIYIKELLKAFNNTIKQSTKKQDVPQSHPL